MTNEESIDGSKLLEFESILLAFKTAADYVIRIHFYGSCAQPETGMLEIISLAEKCKTDIERVYYDSSQPIRYKRLIALLDSWKQEPHDEEKYQEYLDIVEPIEIGRRLRTPNDAVRALTNIREFINSQVDTPPEFNKIFKDRFWDLLA